MCCILTSFFISSEGPDCFLLVVLSPLPLIKSLTNCDQRGKFWPLHV